ncbi:Snf7-domain-containing protein [Hyaloraphidium curvatum]|nr:Snf7-domain-containing protein [Hyaloraphidium curvatum]
MSDGPSLFQRLLGKQPTPDELVRKWRSNIRAQDRELDRQLRGIAAEEEKIKRTMKQAAKRGDVASCRTLAREVARSRKAKTRLHTSKAQLNSVLLQLQHQAAQVKIAGTLKRSTEIMHSMNQLVKLPAIAKVMQEMSQEMMRSGIIEEMMEDVMVGQNEEDIEEEADEEVEKVLWELTDGVLGQANKVGPALEEPAEEETEEKAEEHLERRLNALKG